MIWTKKLPTAGGWYWFVATGDFHPHKTTQKQIPVVVLVSEDLHVRFSSSEAFHVRDMLGVWAGPLKPPKYSILSRLSRRIVT